MQVSKQLEIKAHNGAIYTLDGFENFIFTGSGDCFTAKWNIETGQQESFSIKAEKSIYKIKLLNENKYIILGLSSGAIHIIDLVNKQELKHYTQHKSAIFEIYENKFKNQFYTSDADGNLAIWQSETWDLILFLPLGVGKIRSIITNHDGDIIILACQTGEIKFFDTTNFNELFSLDGHSNGTNFLSFVPFNNEKIIISGGKDGFINFWDLTKKVKILGLPAHNFGIYGIIYLNEGNNFVTISRDKSFKVWDTKTLNVTNKIERKQGGHSHAINAVYKKNEFEFITVGDDKRIIHWKLNK